MILKGTPSDDVAAPVRPEFFMARGEPLFVLLTYPVAFLYTLIFWNAGDRFASNVVVALLTLIFLAAGEILNTKRRAPVESGIWMGGTLLLLAATAMSKLGMYIGIFGFTPLRLQSSWPVVVLLAGGVCAIVSIWTERKTFRVWAIFSAAVLVLTCFY